MLSTHSTHVRANSCVCICSVSVSTISLFLTRDAYLQGISDARLTAELDAARVAEATRIAAIRAAASAYEPPPTLSPQTDVAIGELYTLLRAKLASGAALDGAETAGVFRGIARLIQSNEEQAAALAKEHARCSAATAQVREGRV
jgi:hypothetical protein